MTEKCSEIDEDNSNDDDEEKQPAGRRWDPLGAANEENDSLDVQFDGETRGTNVDGSRIKNLEDEQEMLSSSLLALTSHFAQVQFRLRQIVDASPEDRDQLLQNLEEFAFRGIPEVTRLEVGENEELLSAVDRQRNRQFELIEQLKKQLSEVEKFAYESGAKVLPQSMLVEKQKVIIDELKNKVNLNVTDDDLPQLSSEDLRNQVDCALGEFVGPIKMKDTLVCQLKTQIVDLERFVAYLQCETQDLKQMSKAMAGFKNCETVYNTYNSKMAKSRQKSNKSMGHSSSSSTINVDGANQNRRTSSAPSTPCTDETAPINDSLTSKAASVLEKASTILNMFAVTQLGCGSGRFQRNTLKKTTKGNHWGDLRAQLEVDVQEILSLMTSLPPFRMKHKSDDIDEKPQMTTSSSDSDDSCAGDRGLARDSYANIQLEITAMIRKHFSVTLQKLMEHGLLEDNNQTTSLVPFIGCFSHASSSSSSSRKQYNQRDRQPHRSSTQRQRPTTYGATSDYEDEENSSSYGSNYSRQNDYNSDEDSQMHVWELILEYYHIKNGDKFNDTPARKLSQSFNLDISGGTMSTSNKQSLLSAIGSVISIHAPYKRSYNSHFKAFVSMGLNSQKLTQWLNLIFQCRELIQQYYADWSYVSRTGFRDSLKSIERLAFYQFDLPVDLAVRQFQNIKDVFM